MQYGEWRHVDATCLSVSCELVVFSACCQLSFWLCISKSDLCYTGLWFNFTLWWFVGLLLTAYHSTSRHLWTSIYWYRWVFSPIRTRLPQVLLWNTMFEQTTQCSSGVSSSRWSSVLPLYRLDPHIKNFSQLCCNPVLLRWIVGSADLKPQTFAARIWPSWFCQRRWRRRLWHLCHRNRAHPVWVATPEMRRKIIISIWKEWMPRHSLLWHGSRHSCETIFNRSQWRTLTEIGGLSMLGYLGSQFLHSRQGGRWNRISAGAAGTRHPGRRLCFSTSPVLVQPSSAFGHWNPWGHLTGMSLSRC